MKKICLMQFLFILISGLFFLPGVARSDVKETGKVVSIIIESSFGVSVWLDGSNQTDECSGGARWTISKSDPLFKEKYAAVLAAAISGKTVTLFHLTGYGCGNWDSNQIYYVQVNF